MDRGSERGRKKVCVICGIGLGLFLLERYARWGTATPIVNDGDTSRICGQSDIISNSKGARESLYQSERNDPENRWLMDRNELNIAAKKSKAIALFKFCSFNMVLTYSRDIF